MPEAERLSEKNDQLAKKQRFEGNGNFKMNLLGKGMYPSIYNKAEGVYFIIPPINFFSVLYNCSQKGKETMIIMALFGVDINAS